MIRIGQGVDVHAFAEMSAEMSAELSAKTPTKMLTKTPSNETDAFVTLAGVNIPHTAPLLAHSDGDVVLHALADALLGALALGDIGHHFPDTDEAHAGLDSRILLRHVYQLILDKGYRLVNADITVMCERPKLAPHNLAMRTNIAEDLQTTIDDISVKATTTEKLGFTGRGEGITVTAVVLLKKTG